MGRPSTYTATVAALICERLEGGESLRAICSDEGMPNRATVLKWAETEPFSSQYTQARMRGYLLLADEIVEIADTPQVGTKSVSKATGLEITEGDMIEHRKLQIDTRKWMLSKMLPKVYGDKQQVEHSVSDSLAQTILAARKRSGKES